MWCNSVCQHLAQPHHTTFHSQPNGIATDWKELVMMSLPFTLEFEGQMQHNKY